jgi:toxin-antitoxin system PIN domain toxin
MVIVDANVLLYAVNERAPHHREAKEWVDGALSGDEPVGFAWVVLLAFVRLATLPAAFPIPLSVDVACDLVGDWLAAPASTVVHPTPRHAGLLGDLLKDSGTAGNLVTDAHVAALAIEHGARLCTFDRDFARFAGVRSFTPADLASR